MTPTELYVTVGILFILSIVIKRSEKSIKHKRKNTPTIIDRSKKQTTSRRTSNEVRADYIILSSSLDDDLTWGEFERLLTLYFQDNGYTVEETGTKVRQGSIGDGGVDLVITNRKGERTAVQAKHWSGTIGVEKVRELNSAKRNYNCILCLLITSSTLSQQALIEAEKLKVDCWNGLMLEMKLKKWGKWKPSKKKSVYKDTSQREIAATSENTHTCACGAQMVKRRNKKGQYFFGCSRYPKCKFTKSL